MGGKILVLEDEDAIRSFIRVNLKKQMYEVVEASSGEEALEKLDDTFDIALLDVMLPGIDGFEVCQKAREKYPRLGIIMLTAKGLEQNKIEGLELGADDYIVKPYSTKELVLRVNNMIKRVYHQGQSNIIRYLDYKIDVDKRLVYHFEEEVKLTTLEFDLLLIFLNNLGKSFSRDDILNLVWGDDYFGSDRAVDDLVRRLRKKMPELNISTIYGFGYRMS